MSDEKNRAGYLRINIDQIDNGWTITQTLAGGVPFPRQFVAKHDNEVPAIVEKIISGGEIV